MRLALKVIGLSFIFACICNPAVFADEIPNTNCMENETTQSGSLTVPSGEYSVYVTTDSAAENASIYLNQFDDLDPSHCTSIAENFSLTKDRTAKGSVKISATTATTWYISTANKLTTSVSANRVRLYLVPANLDICIQPSCAIDELTSTSVIPVQSNTATNRLVIAYYVDPSKDSLLQVDYYADSEFAFTKDTLGEFPNEYRAVGKYTTLSTLSKYRSGQVVVKTEKLVIDNDALSVFGFYKLYVFPYLDKIKIVAIFTLSLFCVYILSLLYRSFIAHRRWKSTHGYYTQKITGEIDRDKILRHDRLVASLTDIRKPIIISVAFITILVISNMFIIDLFTVSGHSMDTTLHNDQKVAILKLPATFKKIVSANYIPARGSIVVAKVNQTEGSYTSTFGNGKKSMIKRVVAIPGDRVVVKNNIITVYEQNKGPGKNFDTQSTWAKTMLTTDDLYDIDIILRAGELFLAGDNRDASIDSRINGPVSTKQLVGVLIYKF